MSINRVVLTGNLTHDPDLRALPSGSSVLSFQIAVNDRKKNVSSGEWEDYANYVRCNIFGSRAEALAKYLSKGSKVGIEGKLRWSSWEKDGQVRSKIEVLVDELEFLSPRNNGGGGSFEPAPAPRPIQESSIPDAPETHIYDGDGDIPF